MKKLHHFLRFGGELYCVDIPEDCSSESDHENYCFDIYFDILYPRVISHQAVKPAPTACENPVAP